MSGARRDEAHRWFQQARYDLRAARWNIDGSFHSTACFLAQQAAEKALKALHYYLGSGRASLFTHSLVQMLREGSTVIPELAALQEDGRQLDLHYVPSRYPNGLPAGYPHQFYSPEMSAAAVNAAARMITFVEEFFRRESADDILRGNG
jgi:HEPN domain-containing protein